MGRSRFPGKPLKFQNRKRISVLSGVVYNEAAADGQAPAPAAGAGEKEVILTRTLFVPFVAPLRKITSVYAEMLCLRNNSAPNASM